MKQNIKSLFIHMLFFVIIEILLIVLVLHEFPEINFFETLGIIHLLFWIMLFLSGYIREKLKSYRTKFIATYLPVLFHILGHLYICNQSVKHIERTVHMSNFWIIVTTIISGFFIFLGEYLIHKKFHCENHHSEIHKYCKQE